MLIRNLSTRSDKRKEELKQKELLRIAIANDANIALARKNLKDGILPAPIEGQTFSASELTEDENTNASRARDNLFEVFQPDEVRRILTMLNKDEIKFLNIYWNDVKKDLSTLNIRLVDAPTFVSILDKYVKRTLAQKGIGANVDVNEPSEMRDVVPSRRIVQTAQSRARTLKSPIAGELGEVSNFFPTDKTYMVLKGLSENDQEKYVKKLLKNYKNVAPVNEWLRVLSLPDDRLFLSKIVGLYSGLTPSQANSIKTILSELSRGRSKSPPPRGRKPKVVEDVEASIAEADRFTTPLRPLDMAETPNYLEVSPVTPQGVSQLLAPKKGRGVADKKVLISTIPRWIQVGKLIFNNRLLDEKQLFSVKYPSNKTNPHFPRSVPVSNMFHELITTLTDTQKVDKRILKELEPAEKTLFEKFIVRSGTGRQFDINEVSKTDEEQDKEKRFTLLKGSYMSGNNSPEVVNELRSIILYFVETGRLDKRSALSTLRMVG